MSPSSIEYSAAQKALQPKLADCNINPTSFLATDYLNHYNEIVMLLEMVPDMPELVEDTVAWKPKSYPDHFRDSGFQAAGLAIEAYDAAPSSIRQAFLALTGELDTEIGGTVQALLKVGAAERGLDGAAQSFVRSKIQLIQDRLGILNGVIHGKLPEAEDHKVPEEDTETQAQTQEEIDKLFD